MSKLVELREVRTVIRIYNMSPSRVTPFGYPTMAHLRCGINPLHTAGSRISA